MHRSLLLTCALGLFALPATAQLRSASDGFFLEGALSGQSVTTKVVYDQDADLDDDESEASGGGLGLRLGYGFTPRLAVYGSLTAASVTFEGEDGDEDEDGGLAALDLGLQYSFANASRALVPFLNVGLTGAAIGNQGVDEDDDEDDVTFSGGGLTLGGGVRYHFSPALGVTLGLEGLGARLTTLKVGDDEVDFDEFGIDRIELANGRLRVGLTWFPGR